MADTAIVIAYDGVGASIPRRVAYQRTFDHLLHLGWPIHVAVDNHQPYRLALAVNRTVKAMPEKVIVIHYADIIVPHDQIREAAKLATEAPGQVFAFDTYMFTEEPDPDMDKILEDAPANCCMAIQREAFLEVGGYEERFVGWAMEDREFNDRCGARWPARRVPGVAKHLWHGDRREDGSALETSPEQVLANRKLYDRLR